jgi:hypothetical protein
MEKKGLARGIDFVMRFSEGASLEAMWADRAHHKLIKHSFALT